jgi:hypothetical protein
MPMPSVIMLSIIMLIAIMLNVKAADIELKTFFYEISGPGQQVLGRTDGGPPRERWLLHRQAGRQAGVSFDKLSSFITDAAAKYAREFVPTSVFWDCLIFLTKVGA